MAGVAIISCGIIRQRVTLVKCPHFKTVVKNMDKYPGKWQEGGGGR